MLVKTIKKGEHLKIGGAIITVKKMGGGFVKLAIDAPKAVEIKTVKSAVRRTSKRLSSLVAGLHGNKAK